MAAIVASDLKVKYSVKTGSAGNSTAGTPSGSLGTWCSTTEWPAATINDLFDDITGAENSGSQSDYRCIFIHNTNTANPLTSAVIFISAEVSGGATISLAADTTAASAVGSSTAQALTATSETAPGSSVTSLTYASPTSSATGVSLGTIGIGQVKAVWIKRTATNSSALSGDGVTFSITGDTALA